MTNSPGEAIRDTLQYLPRLDRMPLLWSLSLPISRGWELKAVRLADFRISCTKLHHTCRRCCRYQSTYTLCLPDRMFLTLFCRRLQRIVPGFPSPYFDMRCCLFLEQILWLRKERSGRSTERLPLRHSQRYCPELCSSPDAEYDCQKNNKLEWDETIRVMMDLFDNVWGDRSEIVVDNCVDLTLPVRSPWFGSQTFPMSHHFH
jgi:hypothetical protein